VTSPSAVTTGESLAGSDWRSTRRESSAFNLMSRLPICRRAKASRMKSRMSALEAVGPGRGRTIACGESCWCERRPDLRSNERSWRWRVREEVAMSRSLCNKRRPEGREGSRQREERV
jgi:hypothetical protein